MGYIASVYHEKHGLIDVIYSETSQSIPGAWKNNEEVKLTPEEKKAIARDITLNRRFKRTFNKAYVSVSGYGTFIFPVRSGRFCESKRIEMAVQIANWIQLNASFNKNEYVAISEGKRIADNASKCKNVIYEAKHDSWKLTAGEFTREVYASNKIHILDGM